MNNFLLVLKNYLERYKFSNAEKDDLWECLDEQAKDDDTLDEDLNIKDIMDTWITKKGYPVVTVIYLALSICSFHFLF